MKPRFLVGSRFSSALSFALAGLLATSSVKAINYWWDIDGASTTSTVATGTWSSGSASNWSTSAAGNIATSAVTTTNADDLTLYATGMTAGTITVSGTQAARRSAASASWWCKVPAAVF